jgi:hypothetical protein
MRNLFVTFVFFLANLSSNAQLANGSLFPAGLVLTDINGSSYNLDADLNNGKTLFIIVSATWSGPDWSFHNLGIMQELYNSYGPQGTNELRVYFIEGMSSTTIGDLYGIGTNTQGDWVTGTPYPIVDNSSAADALQVGFYPTLYMICPSRRVWHISPSVVNGYWTAAEHYANAQACTNPIDAKMNAYTGETSTCGLIQPFKVQIQNKGVNTLTSATVSASVGSTTLSSFNWSGSLAQFQQTEVSFGSATFSSSQDVVFSITPSGSDVAPANNSIVQGIAIAPSVPSSTVIVKITTDRFGSESTWRIKRSNNTIVASGGPYADLSTSGTTIQTPVTVTLPASDCYYFEMLDSYGDGLCCQYGNGSYQVTDANNNVLISGGEFGDSERNALSYNANSNGLISLNGFSQTNDPAPITFSNSPTGCPSFSYQWYSFNGITSAPSGNSTSGWTLIPGATSSSYDPSTLFQSTTFACFVTPSAGCGTPGWAAGAASFTIISSAGQVNSTLVQQCEIAPVELSFTAAPNGLGNVAYQWYYQIGEVGCPQGSSTFGWQIVSGGNTVMASFTPPSAGTYTIACFINSETGVGLWASGCKIVVSASFTSQEIIGNPTVTPFTPTAYLVSQVSGHTYQWSVTGGAIANGQGTNFVNVVWSNTGPYSIQLIESDGVCSDVSVLDLGVVTGVNKEDDNGLSIFPNPASDYISIRGLGENANGKYTLYDLSGRALQTGLVSGNGCSVPVGNLNAGNYAIHVITSKLSSVNLIHVSRNQ